MASFLCGRDDRIRTCDPLVPNQVLYQAEPHPDKLIHSHGLSDKI